MSRRQIQGVSCSDPAVTRTVQILLRRANITDPSVDPVQARRDIDNFERFDTLPLGGTVAPDVLLRALVLAALGLRFDGENKDLTVVGGA